jgi:hypothetical protein
LSSRHLSSSSSSMLISSQSGSLSSSGDTGLSFRSCSRCRLVSRHLSGRGSCHVNICCCSRDYLGRLSSCRPNSCCRFGRLSRSCTAGRRYNSRLCSCCLRRRHRGRNLSRVVSLYMVRPQSRIVSCHCLSPRLFSMNRPSFRRRSGWALAIANLGVSPNEGKKLTQGQILTIAVAVGNKVETVRSWSKHHLAHVVLPNQATSG